MRKWNVYNIIVFAMGIFATMPIVTITVSGSDISLFRILFYLILVWLFIKTFGKTKISIKYNIKLFDYWLILSLISCFFGWLLLINEAPEFSKMAFGYIPKILLYLVFTVMWTNQKHICEKNNILLKGLLVGCILNIIWAIIDAVGYYTIGISINNIVFQGYSERNNIRYNLVSLTYSNGMIRSGGFNYDPAHLGYITPVIAGYACYKKKYGLLILVLGGILASASTTSFVASVCVMFIMGIVFRDKRVIKITKKKIIMMMGAVVTIGITITLYGEQLLTVLSTSGSKMLSRVSSTYLNAGNADVRWDYFRLLPKVLLNLNFKSIFGLGFGNASYGYVTDSKILHQIGIENNFAYDLENTYICYLLDTGIIGIVLFLFLIIIVVKYYNVQLKRKATKEANIIIYSCILAMIISMFFYHYILFTPHMLILIIALSQIDETKIGTMEDLE